MCPSGATNSIFFEDGNLEGDTIDLYGQLKAVEIENPSPYSF